MEEKMEGPILHVCGWVNGCIAIAVVRSYSHMIRRAHLLSTLRDRDPDWELGSGLGMLQ